MKSRKVSKKGKPLKKRSDSFSEDLDEAEMELAFKEFGFDGLFNTKNDEFNAARVYQEEELDKLPMQMQNGVMTEPKIDDDFEDAEVNEVKPEPILNKQQQQQLQQQQQQQQEIKRDIKPLQTSLIPKVIREISIPASNALSISLNMLSETNIQSVIDKFTQHQDQSVQPIIYLIQSLESDSYMVPTISVFILGLMIYFEPVRFNALIRGIINEYIVNDSETALILLSYMCYYSCLNPECFKQILEMKQITLQAVLKVFRICGTKINMKQIKLTFKPKEDPSLTEEQRKMIKETHEQLLEDVTKKQMQENLYTQSFMVVLENTLTELKKQAIMHNKRQQLETYMDQTLEQFMDQQENNQKPANKIQVEKKTFDILQKYNLEVEFQKFVQLTCKTIDFSEDLCVTQLQMLIENTPKIQNSFNKLVRFYLEYVADQLEFDYFYAKVFKIFQKICDEKFKIVVCTCFWDFFKSIPNQKSGPIVNISLLLSLIDYNKILTKSLLNSEIKETNKKSLMFFDLFCAHLLQSTHHIEQLKHYKNYLKQFKARLTDDVWKAKVEGVAGQCTKMLNLIV
ncbi:Conserved_hypothetical protein [Hexamita inflata]|uniref:MI domain-containing protein n=2 Tax=Hexamita inflata TaxID=28002 RepID=A0AA86QXV3_9EUKA|nr:Conserved hypothetical protein [Hexamita inflata]